MIETDAVIVGAGPCGLFQVFELGLQGINAHIIDNLKYPGGQCSELYPEKPIYDIPAVPVCSAQELVDRLMEQIKPFAPEFHLGQEVTTVEPIEDGARFKLTTNKGTTFLTRSVIIAGGLGSFQPRKLRFKGVDQFEGKSINYRVTDKNRYKDRDVVILGGGDSALDWALELQPIARRITLVHRRDGFRAAPASVDQFKQLCATEPDKARLVIAYVKDYETANDALSGVILEDQDKQKSSLACEELLVFYGLLPNLGPIADWGLTIEKRQIAVDTEKFETNIAGIYAIGDISTYPGKKKLILSGFHEAALAAFAIKKRLNPDEKVMLQYTTTSPLMHERLGVEAPTD